MLSYFLTADVCASWPAVSALSSEHTLFWSCLILIVCKWARVLDWISCQTRISNLHFVKRKIFCLDNKCCSELLRGLRIKVCDFKFWWKEMEQEKQIKQSADCGQSDGCWEKSDKDYQISVQFFNIQKILPQNFLTNVLSIRYQLNCTSVWKQCYFL